MNRRSFVKAALGGVAGAACGLPAKAEEPREAIAGPFKVDVFGEDLFLFIRLRAREHPNRPPLIFRLDPFWLQWEKWGWALKY